MFVSPDLSSQIRSVIEGEDDGWGVLYRAREMQKEGKDITVLAVGDHDFSTPAPIVAACKSALDEGRTGYGSVQGMAPLRDLIAKRGSAVHGTEIDPSSVVISVGGQSALFAAFKAVLDPGDEAIIFEPYYATYAQTTRATGGVPVIVGTVPEHGFQPEVEKVRAAITPRTRMVLLNSPNNPTGAVYTRETLEGIAGLCIEHDLWLVSDEVYHTQVYETSHLSPASLPGMRERTLIVDSMSKSHAMTGWRAGWIICPNTDIAERIVDLFLVATYGLPPFIQLAMRAGLAIGVEPEHEIASRYRLRRDVAVRALSSSKRLTVRPPSAAMYLFLDLRAFCSDGRVFAERLLEECSIAAMPGESFGASGAGHLRISLTAQDERLDTACRQIAEFADAWRD